MKDSINRGRRIADELRAFVGELDADVMCGELADALHAVFNDVVSAGSAGAALTAKRIADTNAWRASGATSAADYLAKKDGVTAVEAARTLKTGARMQESPRFDEAYRSGALSPAKAHVVARGDAANESDLLGRADSDSVVAMQRRVAQLKSAEATYARARKLREFSEWEDHDSQMWRFAGGLPLGDAAPVRARLRKQFEDVRRRHPENTQAQSKADAFVELITAAGGEGVAPAPQIMVTVDYEAFVRGFAEGDETCEVQGLGSVPVSLVQQWSDCALMKVVIDKGAKGIVFRSTSRAPNKRQREFIIARDGLKCAVPGCDNTFRLEWDHRRPWTDKGPTHVDNLCLLCWHHHRMKSEQGWCLVGRFGVDELQWVKRREKGDGGMAYPLEGIDDGMRDVASAPTKQEAMW